MITKDYYFTFSKLADEFSTKLQKNNDKFNDKELDIIGLKGYGKMQKLSVDFSIKSSDILLALNNDNVEKCFMELLFSAKVFVTELLTNFRNDRLGELDFIGLKKYEELYTFVYNFNIKCDVIIHFLISKEEYKNNEVLQKLITVSDTSLL